MFKIRQIVLIVLFLAQGIFKVLKESGDFSQLEEQLSYLIHQGVGMLISFALDEIDRKLLAQKDQGLKVIGKRQRTLITTAGEIKVNRRLYQNQEGEYIFLLDEALGLEPRLRVSKRMQELMLELATEMPFRRAAKVLGYITPLVSPMSVWTAVKAAGEEACAETLKLKTEVFENGVVPEGQRSVNRLFIEGDEVHVKQQRGSCKNLGIKLVVGYEGKVGSRRKLKNRHSVAGVTDGPGIWEEASCVFSQKWLLSELEQVRIGGDGAPWIKKGTEVFPGASYHLDPFHLRKRLTEALSFSCELYENVCRGLRQLDKEAVVKTLDDSSKLLRGARKKRVKDLKRYLMDNWSGISNLPEDERLGAIEGQVRHTIARRMKRIGARWTVEGGDRMGRLLAAKANDELTRYVNKSKISIEKLLESDEPIKKETTCSKDVESWLKASMPALVGPSAGKPWVKYVLREIGSIKWPA